MINHPQVAIFITSFLKSEVSVSPTNIKTPVFNKLGMCLFFWRDSLASYHTTETICLHRKDQQI
jgi:hypothetical protein